jgi:TPR repeat protein
MFPLKRPSVRWWAREALAAMAMCVAVTVPALAEPSKDASAAWDRGDYVVAMRMYRPLADRGNTEAQHKIGTMYQNGWGVPQSYGQALKWFQSAANQGDPQAQKSLGFMFLYGRGVHPDRVTAQMWFILASSGGNASAALAIKLAAAEMSPEQVAEATDRARQWQTTGRAPSPEGDR